MFIGLGLVWGSSFLWTKLALREIGPFTLVTIRIFLALLGIAVIMWRAKVTFPLRQKFGLFLFLGLFNMSIPFVLASWAQKSIPSGLASILNSTMPLWTLVISAALLPNERITRRKVVGLLLGFGGVVVLMSNQLGEGFGDFQVGILAMLLSAFFYGMGTVVIKLKAGGITSQALTTGQMLMAWLAVTPLTLVVEAPFRLPVEPLTWFALAWMGILGSAIGLVVYFSMLYEIGPTRAAMTTYLLPLVGVALGIIFLGEQPDWRMLAGGLMVVAGVWWVNRRINVRAT